MQVFSARTSIVFFWVILHRLLRSSHIKTLFTRYLSRRFIARWVTIGEALALVVYVLLMVSMVYQGVGFKMAAYYGETMICIRDSSARCYEGSEERATASSVTM